jgi:hypothetical protein
LALQSQPLFGRKTLGESVDIEHQGIGHLKHAKLSLISAHTSSASNPKALPPEGLRPKAEGSFATSETVNGQSGVSFDSARSANHTCVLFVR